MGKDKKQVTRVRVAAIIVENGHILLAHHRREELDYWVLPGGGVEYAETLEEALVRELKEEANLDVAIERLVMVNDSIPPDQRRHIVNLYFTACVTGGVLRCDAHDKRLCGMEFVPLADLPGLTLYPTILEPLMQGIASGFAEAPGYLRTEWKEF